MPAKVEPRPGLREELLARVHRGEISPRDAEDEALLAGCDPLATSPESLGLDPTSEPNWSLVMSLVWIITRDLTAVAGHWTRARQASTHLVQSPRPETPEDTAEDKPSWELLPLAPPTVRDIHAIIENGESFLSPPLVVPGWEAREYLWAKLRTGSLAADGDEFGTGQRATIPPAEWNDLEWLNEPSTPADAVHVGGQGIPKYFNVLVSARRVRELWPDLDQLLSGEYEREDWDKDHSILWIRYRNPALFHFVGLTIPRARAHFSQHQAIVPDADAALLKALQIGQLRGIQRGRLISPEYWFGKGLPGLQSNSRRIYFRRSDVIANWPALDVMQHVGVLLNQLWREKGKRPSGAASYDFVKDRGDCKGATSQKTWRWIDENWGPGKQGRGRSEPEPPLVPYSSMPRD